MTGKPSFDSLDRQSFLFLQRKDDTCYVGVSKSSQTSSTDRQRIALRECVRYA
jgi:hypothetical protein